MSTACHRLAASRAGHADLIPLGLATLTEAVPFLSNIKNIENVCEGGILAPSSSFVSENDVTVALTNYLQQTEVVNFVYDADIIDIERAEGRIIGVRDSCGELYKADTVIISAVSAANIISSTLAVNLPLLRYKVKWTACVV